ncbi:protein serine/threonine phosphatase [Beutenbergia cavernae DSM 12333]|uniref:Protein serine/threonine phosphatase n=1 Tax=Beutenbergia cavernae (strain ATCC BAA-8 / DSM 12333 / CCUG 43141 / JCM 11478 / NBRC 16432 / NCIMB 13614 / HKI 0122) TaxID=471853 RepID=C5C336_BEUC1|nr:SpoIIE family protein phosphatase [Beutenbergia cavernae]ACQ81880.1 protein serine/threonine phosphatase [Beutenbergia cavernae DSM 12333]
MTTTTPASGDEFTPEEFFTTFAASDVAFFVLDVVDGEPRIPWVNRGFTELTGHDLDALRHDARAIFNGMPEKSARDSFKRSVLDGDGLMIRALCYTRDGAPFWGRFVISPVRPGRAIIALRDITDDMRALDDDAMLFVTERRVRLGLDAVSRVSDLLIDVEDAGTLRAVTHLLSGVVVRWSAFFAADGGMHPIDGLEPSSSDRRGRSIWHGSPDPVLRLLEGSRVEEIELSLEEEPAPFTATGDLVTALRRHADLPDDVTSVVVLPVLGRVESLGVMVLVPLEDADGRHTVARLVARRVGMAIENARLLQREHLMAETLQRAMLPEQAEVTGLDVWTYYSPNAEHAQVGGDWYDVLYVNPDTVGVVVGDVVGHDMEAAAAMGQLRSVVRSYACELVDPGTVLSRVDDLVASMRLARSASLVYGALTPVDQESGRWRFDYSRAGHMPPLLVRDGEVTQLDGAAGVLVGFGSVRRATAGVDLVAGDVLVFYTDGLVERRARALRAGIAELVETCRTLGANGADDAAGVGEALLAAFAEEPEDDVAIVVVRIPRCDQREIDPGVRSWRIELEPDVRSTARAREAVVRVCDEWGVRDAPAAELVTSELVANAVMHGWGRVALRLRATSSGLRVEVEDGNPTPPTLLGGHASGLGGFGMQIVERLADWGWRPSGHGKVVWALVRPRSGEEDPLAGLRG